MASTSPEAIPREDIVLGKISETSNTLFLFHRVSAELSRFLEMPNTHNEFLQYTSGGNLPEIWSRSQTASTMRSGISSVTKLPASPGGRRSQISTPDTHSVPILPRNSTEQRERTHGRTAQQIQEADAFIETQFKSLKDHYEEQILQAKAQATQAQQPTPSSLPPISSASPPVASVVEVPVAGNGGASTRDLTSAGSFGSESGSDRGTRILTSSSNILRKFGKVDTPLYLLSDECKAFAHLFGVRLPSEYHTHPHSGNRLWSNSRCSLCLQENIELHDQTAEILQAEQNRDKIFLDMAKEVDREEEQHKQVVGHGINYLYRSWPNN